MTYTDDPNGGGYDDDRFDDNVAQLPEDTETLLRHAIDAVSSAKAMPLSSSVLVSRDELLDLLEHAIEVLPEELRQSRWVLRDLDALTEQRHREADALMDEVKVEAARLISRTEIARQAKAHAERVVADAEERGRAIIHEAEDFCDQRLAQMEIVLDRLTKTVQSGRERLRPRIETIEDPEDAGAPDEGAFFDQDTV
jgi:hypothetical protein